MPLGAGGKYDEQCERILLDHGASLVAVLVLRGDRGEGFSVSTRDPSLVTALPELLESMARSIREDLVSGPPFAEGCLAVFDGQRISCPCGGTKKSDCGKIRRR